MISFVVLKPHFIYDHNKKQYKEFGNSNNKTLVSLPVIAIVIAIIMGIIFCNIIGSIENQNNKQIPISHPAGYYSIYPYHPNYSQPFIPLGQPYFKPNLVQ
jgi:hypothetical protein